MRPEIHARALRRKAMPPGPGALRPSVGVCLLAVVVLLADPAGWGPNSVAAEGSRSGGFLRKFAQWMGHAGQSDFENVNTVYMDTEMYNPLLRNSPDVYEDHTRPAPTSLFDAIHFYLYTRDRNFAQPLYIGDDAALQASDFKFDRPTKFLIHGFGAKLNKSMIQNNKEAYLAAMDVNVVAVDWSALAAAPWYGTARKNVEVVGHRVAEMLDWLVQRGADINSFHLVGHSLGAHVAGVAGHNVRSGKIPRITGLDPARPGFLDTDLSGRLDSSDAQLVDVIHTTAGLYGMTEPMGHLDFYPNRGVWRQPGCSMRKDIYGRCSHAKAYQLFADSIGTAGYRAYACSTVQSALRGECNGDYAIMGDLLTASHPGIYYTTTR